MRLLTRRLAVSSATLSLVVTGLIAPTPSTPEPTVRSESVQVTEASGPGFSRSVETPVDAELVGFEWDGEQPGVVELRVRQGEGWGEWTEVTGNPDEGPDRQSPERQGAGGRGLRTTAGPVWVGRDVERVEVRVAEGELRGLRLHAVDSEDRRDGAEGGGGGGGGGVRGAVGVRGAAGSPAQPTIIPRSGWGADESWRRLSPGCTGTPSYASGVRNSFVHHTVTANGYNANEADDYIRGVYRFHTQTNGWCDVGYNFLVDRFGRVYEGRAGGTNRPVIGGHTAGFNTGSTGVALLGDFTRAGVPPATVTALTRLLSWKLGYHGVDPRRTVDVTSRGSTKYADGVNVTLPAIAGHRDASLTSCPGDRAYPLLPALRGDVQRDLLSTAPNPLPGWVPRGTARLLTVNAYGGLQPVGAASPVGHSWYLPTARLIRGAAASGGGAAGGYTVDAFGGLHQFGSAPPRTPSATFPTEAARGIARGPAANSGWVLHAIGSLHPYGGAPAVRGPAFGFDIARGVATSPDGRNGYVLDGFGGVHPFGSAPRVAASGYWPGWDIARGIAVRPDGRSGYVLDGFGGLHPFGGAPPLAVTRYVQRDVFRGLVLNAAGTGGWTVDADGFVWRFGAAEPVTESGTYTGTGLATGLVRLS